MRDWHGDEVTTRKHCAAGCDLEERLCCEQRNANDRDPVARRKHEQCEERAVDSRQSAIGRDRRREREHCQRHGHDAGEQRRLEREVATRTECAEKKKRERVPGELLIREMCEVTGDDAPQRAAALQLQRGAGYQRGGEREREKDER